MTIRNLVLWSSLAGFLPFAVGQTSATKSISAADAANHIGEKAVVCGNVVDSKISKYALSGHGHPVNLDLDQPEPTPSFFLVTFGSDGEKPEQVVSKYQGKQLCVTGKVSQLQGVPFIMVSDLTQIQVQSNKK